MYCACVVRLLYVGVYVIHVLSGCWLSVVCCASVVRMLYVLCVVRELCICWLALCECSSSIVRTSVVLLLSVGWACFGRVCGACVVYVLGICCSSVVLCLLLLCIC